MLPTLCPCHTFLFSPSVRPYMQAQTQAFRSVQGDVLLFLSHQPCTSGLIMVLMQTRYRPAMSCVTGVKLVFCWSFLRNTSRTPWSGARANQLIHFAHLTEHKVLLPSSKRYPTCSHPEHNNPLETFPFNFFKTYFNITLICD